MASDLIPFGSCPGEPRQLTLEEHFLNQRPHWRHWYGVFTKWDVQTGETLEAYNMERDLQEVEPNGKKVGCSEPVHLTTLG
jgi:hypothetical protein